jgi:membrane peptidoglycan carboxypeptidase
MVFSAVLLGGLGGATIWEMQASEIQAHLLSRYVQTLTYRLEPGPSSAVRFPDAGPYDIRLGYDRIPDFVGRLQIANHKVKAQSTLSAEMLELADRGLYLPHSEKDQTGLRILDREGRVLYEAQNPERIYKSFAEVPLLVVESLLQIENRELLDPRFPKRNPTVEWDRLAKAAMKYAFRGGSGERSPGGSSLATQIEKSRHSPRGITGSVSEKVRQMTSASLRVYLDGTQTHAAQRRIVRTYLNSLPLAAVPGHGEVLGLAEGLERWFGADFDAVNRLLKLPESGLSPLQKVRRAMAYRKVLSLLLAQRRPTYYLVQDPDALRSLTDSYLRLFARSGVISSGLRDLALLFEIEPERGGVAISPGTLPNRKAADVIRSQLVEQLGLSDLYELDRLDLTVQSTLDRDTQDKLAGILRDMTSPATLEALGLKGPRLLGRGDPSGVTFSILLCERGDGVNWLRVMSDNLDQAFSVSDGTKLDLGSTAKLRTLVTYLDVIAALYRRYANLPPEARQQNADSPTDRLTKWVVAHLSQWPESSLSETLEAALDRRYSASPHEQFFTGGGLHRFQNYDSKRDREVLSVRTALHHSVNLVFIRLMRDIVDYYQFQLPGSPVQLLSSSSDPRRRAYLERFADRESREYLRRYYKEYSGQHRDAALDRVLNGVARSLKRLAAVLRYVEPNWTLAQFDKEMRARSSDKHVSAETMHELYDRYRSDRFDLGNRGHVTGLHPLELWLLAYLGRNPHSSFDQALGASVEERRAAYNWLFNTRHKNAQDLRIRSELEIDAFSEIHRDWQRFGYPFDRLVPSYATAIGSSADRPMALADLMGVLVNDGVRYPLHRMSELSFAASTPYETVLGPKEMAGERVLPVEVARAVKAALVGTVSQGTARRANGAVRSADGGPATIGGKTGTGDHRFKVFGPGARLLEERVVSRSAAFIFYVDDRYFGVISAYVKGPHASRYKFTSSLPVQLFRVLAPVLFGEPGEVRTARLAE